MYQLGTWDHDGYNKLSHFDTEEFDKALLKAIHLALHGNQRYSRSVDVRVDDKRLLSVFPEGARKLKELGMLAEE